MLNTYFFVPANKKKFIDKVPGLSAHNFIFDLEDSVSIDTYDEAFNNLREMQVQENFLIRPKLEFEGNSPVSANGLISLKKLGFTRFVLPKIENIRQLESVMKVLGKEDVKIILLVENPKLLINLKEVVESGIAEFIGIGLGSHDYTDFMGMKHTLDNLNYAENHVLNIAKAFDIDAIDKASMNLGDAASFEKECFAAFDSGYEAKFILSPFQLNIINSIKYYSDDEIREAELVFNEINNLPPEQFSVVKVNGVLYEKPHLKRLKRIIDWKDNAGI
jgi:citrate lyase beta subunit